MSLQVVRTRRELETIIARWKSQSLKIGFVPTMGALHKGHISLVNIALKNADKCVVSIFVNPTQFAPHEDFASYPRDEESDLAKLEKAGVHLVYIPDVKEIYPDGPVSDIKAGLCAQGLESDFRPHFFDGVCSVVYRLFDHVKPDIAVFGEKDYQQLIVITEMVKDKALPIRIVPGPIIRDAEGLALSSRNAYLSAEELKLARQLNVILSEAAYQISRHCDPGESRGKQSIQQKDGDGQEMNCFVAHAPRNDEILNSAKQKLRATGFDEVQYVAERWERLLAAVKIGKTRLIDNVNVDYQAEILTFS